MYPLVPFIISGLALLGSGIGWLLADLRMKERTSAAAATAKAIADSAKTEAAHASEELVQHKVALGKADEARAALVRDIDRLSRDKADTAVVLGIQAAINEVRSEMIRQFDRLEARIEFAQTARSTPRKRT